eukprot:748658-Hanusia_phi.AAC.5
MGGSLWPRFGLLRGLSAMTGFRGEKQFTGGLQHKMTWHPRERTFKMKKENESDNALTSSRACSTASRSSRTSRHANMACGGFLQVAVADAACAGENDSHGGKARSHAIVVIVIIVVPVCACMSAPKKELGSNSAASQRTVHARTERSDDVGGQLAEQQQHQHPIS